MVKTKGGRTPLMALSHLTPMTFSRNGLVNSNGNFDRRYARGLGRTTRQQSADFFRSYGVRRFRSNSWF